MYCATSFWEREHSSKRDWMYLARLWWSLEPSDRRRLRGRACVASSAATFDALPPVPARALGSRACAARSTGSCTKISATSFRTFLAREVIGGEGRYGEWEREGIVPREVFAKAGAGGFLAMAVPERYGGAGVRDFRFNLVIGEEAQYAGGRRLRARHHAAQRHLPALLHALLQRRAARALAAGDRHRRADHGARDDRARHRLATSPSMTTTRAPRRR